MAEEIEVKFAVAQLGDFRQRLLAEGGRPTRDRVLERNWRFDTAEASLTSANKVLRLRQDVRATLAYKQAGSDPLERIEIELEVSQPEQAKALLMALGYQIILIYEKYREVFDYQGAEVVLDQLPFGNFIEIEAEAIDQLQIASRELSLDWSRRVTSSYLEIFAAWKDRAGRDLRQATFATFADIAPITLKELGLEDALRSQPSGAV